jgi:hypothetical protein
MKENMFFQKMYLLEKELSWMEEGYHSLKLMLEDLLVIIN